MDNIAYIEIRITGSVGNIALSPDTFDIHDIIPILENAEKLLYPLDKTDRRNRPTISYQIEEGSIKHIFKTSLQYIIALNAIIGEVYQSQNIDFLSCDTAKAFENIQEIASKRNFTFDIKTSLDNTNRIKIDNTTHFYRTESLWVNAEFYFYGKITNAGGKDKANIHIVTKELGTIKIQTPISFLEQQKDNLLYKVFGIRASGKQHSETGEIDTSTLQFIELYDYQLLYDDAYLKSLRDKAEKSWLYNINSDEWLKNIRGGYDA